MKIDTARDHPTIRREDISWRTVGRFVEIEIAVTNASDMPTEDAQIVIEAAAFGAFVPFEPVTRIAVAGFEPWERRSVTTMVPFEQLDRHREFPQLMAILGEDGLAQFLTSASLEEVLDFEWSVTPRESNKWIGNLNVYFDGEPDHAVERHCAFDLRVQCERKVAVQFVVNPDRSYSMSARSSDPAWALEVDRLGPRAGVLRVIPPAKTGLQATIDVFVTRRTDGKTVRVEFAMETVAGSGGTIGCVQV